MVAMVFVAVGYRIRKTSTSPLLCLATGLH